MRGGNSSGRWRTEGHALYLTDLAGSTRILALTSVSEDTLSVWGSLRRAYQAAPSPRSASPLPVSSLVSSANGGGAGPAAPYRVISPTLPKCSPPDCWTTWPRP